MRIPVCAPVLKPMRSGEPAGHAQGQARHEPQHDPGQLPLHDDDLDDLAPLPLERIDDLLGGDGELP